MAQQQSPQMNITSEQSQLLVGGFAPSMAVGVQIVNACCDGIWKTAHQMGVHINSVYLILLFSIAFALLVFFLDKVPTRIRILFFIFNAFSLLYFTVSTNNAAELQKRAGYECSIKLLCAVGAGSNANPGSER